MSAISLSPMIRKATASEFPLIANLFYQTFSPDPIVSLLWHDCTPDSIRTWYLPKPSDCPGTVLVAQEQETKEIVGLAWYYPMSSKNPPTVPDEGSFPPGYNLEDSAKMRAPRMAWQNSLIKQYGEYICSCITFDNMSSNVTDHCMARL
jgi:hypothetical protein